MFHKQASAVEVTSEEGDLTVCPGTFRIERSLFSSLSNKLTRSFTTDGNRTRYTYSAWVKRTARNPNWASTVYPNSVTENEILLLPVTNDSNNYGRIAFQTEFKNQSTGAALSNPDIFYFLNRNNGTTNTHTIRDYHPPDGTWDHVMVVYDSPNATQTLRVRYYLNGNKLDAGRYSKWPAQNATSHINRALVHEMLVGYTGYIAEVHFVDGQALGPSVFGQQCDITGKWEPIDPQISDYGTNGFRLEFKDGNDIGKDTSGKNNHWTNSGAIPENISIDTPTHRPAVKNIEKSLNAKDGGLMSKTFPSDGNRRVWTLSWWYKAESAGDSSIISPYLDANRYSKIKYDIYEPFKVTVNNRQQTDNDVLSRINQSNHEPPTGFAWFHFVVTANTPHSIATERTKMWVNGVLDPASDHTTPPQNTQWWINSTVAQRLFLGGNCLFADVIFVDGKVLDPTAFGYKNPDTGEWYPREYEGKGFGDIAYGNNGYHLEFLDPANLGKDTSGNGNDFAVTLYTSSDLTDETPTNPI
ncbi:MAG: LamG-like jellyroll fold domain-containing protein [Betaproteobacteria bacterium]